MNARSLILMTILGTLWVPFELLAQLKERNLCDLLFHREVKLEMPDLELFAQSKFGPVLSGGAIPNAATLARNPGLSPEQMVNRWNVYFVRGAGVCYDSPSAAAKVLKPQLDELARRRMENFDVRIGETVELFLYCGAGVAESALTENPKVKHVEFLNSGLSLYAGRYNNVTVNLGGRALHYRFPAEASLIFLSDGDSVKPSAWTDRFVAAHEIGHSSTPDQELREGFLYFEEGMADFKAYRDTGITSYLWGGREMSSARYNTIPSYFDTYSERGTAHSFGAMLAYQFYMLWQRLQRIDPERAPGLMDRYFKRLSDLLLSESPQVTGEFSGLKGVTSKWMFYDRTVTTKITNFIAGSSMQWSIEEKMPIALTEWLCSSWKDVLGGDGHYARQRAHVMKDYRTFVLSPAEIAMDTTVRIPESWSSCQELSRFLRAP